MSTNWVTNEVIEQQTPAHGDAVAAGSVVRAVDIACRRTAPLFPLDSFVAVNPFVGMADLPFPSAAELVARTAGGRLALPLSHHEQALQDGRILDADLEQALALYTRPAGAPDDATSLRAFVRQHAQSPVQPLPTVASLTGRRRGADLAAVITSHLSSWAGTYFDEGQAVWRSPWRHLPPYAAFRAEARHDRSLEVLGLSGIRKHLSALPRSADALFEHAAATLGLPPEAQPPYFQRLLAELGGWAGYARYIGFSAELSGRSDGTLRELLAIRLALECAILECQPGLDGRKVLLALYDAHTEWQAQPDHEVEAYCVTVLQTAHEFASQRRLRWRLERPVRKSEPERPSAQLVFCIDVRSEVLRRALESVESSYATLGFAGFFGFPIEHVPVGASHGHAHCPVLLKPGFRIPQASGDAALPQRRAARIWSDKAWSAFKKSAVSSFGFVEALGLTHLGKLVSDTLGRSPDLPAQHGLQADEAQRLTPDLTAQDGLGMSLEEQVERAEAVLRGMSLTKGFAPLVVLVGHGSRSTNNPHAAGLDCGACGGHSGAPNARVACAVLNTPAVRRALKDRGIDVPEDTVFIAAEHNTTTDEVEVFHAADSHPEVNHLRAKLKAASAIARAERAERFGSHEGPLLDAARLSTEAQRKAADWSEVRPEWGLAGCSSFVVGPRSLTRGLNLKGRSFLHNYDWRQDRDFSVLELIMTAPMVVTSWISLQYYASTVDNETFGCGNKTLHNVVGGLGVLEGAEGTLRSGLSLQSVHDGSRAVHDPVKLAVHIAAPIEAMNDVLRQHPSVRALVDHGWIYLLAVNDEGRVTHRYEGELSWKALAAGVVVAEGAA